MLVDDIFVSGNFGGAHLNHVGVRIFNFSYHLTDIFGCVLKIAHVLFLQILPGLAAAQLAFGVSVGSFVTTARLYRYSPQFFSFGTSTIY